MRMARAAYGKRVNGQWQECRADDPEATPDLNRANEMMGQRKGAEDA